MDDLLEEVEQLENSTQALESATQNTANQKQKLVEANNTVSAEANLLALETAKTAQDAANQSHQAAKAAIKQAETLKEQVLELNESNFHWRQAVRNANKEIETIKGKFSIMLIISILFSLIATGAMGYLLYAMQNKEAQFKGEVFDMLSTENTLLDKKVTLKMDELASVIEILTHKVAQGANVKNISDVRNHKEESIEEIANTDQQANEHVANLAKELNTEQPTEKATEPKTEHATEQSVSKNTDEKNTNASLSKEEYTELKQLIEQVLTAQKSLQNQTHVTNTVGLTKDNVKKLNDISWLVRKQDKTLKTIESKIGINQKQSNKQSNSNSIVNELKQLQKQQTALQNQLNNMQAAIKKIDNQTKEPKPYSYKAK
ncbi:hypothetical protein JCM30760_09050 [Thiomicrorhabdus hydrogeniphila]